ncbi:hypothetical protein PG993_006914 [Apiospora rasikravindrae]|uniref:Uncharacterized protein n=1 Tax=Apiospora rasikravindrae TaxID=990691 RepID=A0ABR1SW11_9PEZI
MAGSSAQSVCGGATPSKPSHAIAAQTGSPSKESMAKKQTRSYMSTKNGGGNSVTALALRPETSAQSTAQRLERVAREMAEATSQL